MIQRVRYRSDNGVYNELGKDLRNAGLVIYSASADGFVAYPMTGFSDGRATVNRVPNGEYTLVAGNWAVVSSSNDIDLSYEVAGRGNVATTSESSTNSPRTAGESRARASQGGSSRPSSELSRGSFHSAPSATKETTSAAPAPMSSSVKGSGRSSRDPTPWATSPPRTALGVTGRRS